MLSQFWLLTILASLALGVPTPDESVVQVVRVNDTKSDTGTPSKMPINSANKQISRLKVGQDKVGSKSTSDDQGSPSLGGYSARGTGVSYSGILSGTSEITSDGISGGISSAVRASQESQEGAGHGEQHDRVKGSKMREQSESNGSGNTIDSTSGTGSEEMTTDATAGSKGTIGAITGRESTTSGTTIDEDILGSDIITDPISKHEKRLTHRRRARQRY